MAPIFINKSLRYLNSGNSREQIVLPDDTNLSWTELSGYNTYTGNANHIINILSPGQGKNIELGSPYNCKIKMVNVTAGLKTTAISGFKVSNAVTYISKQLIKIPNMVFPVTASFMEQCADSIYNAIKDEELKNLILTSKYSYITEYANSNGVTIHLSDLLRKIIFVTYTNIYGQISSVLEGEGTTTAFNNTVLGGYDYSFSPFNKSYDRSTKTYTYFNLEERRKSRIMENIYGEKVKYVTTTPNSSGVTTSNYSTFVPSKVLGIDENGNPVSINYSEKDVYVMFGFTI